MGSEKANANIAMRQKAKKSPMPNSQYRDCQQTAFAIWGRANIPWTQEHVDVFHNDGNYVQYANL